MRTVLLNVALILGACNAFSASGVRRSAFGARQVRAEAIAMSSPAPAPATKTRTRQITKPSVGQPAKPAQQQKAQTAQPKLQQQDAHIPMWKVLLLGDEEYEEDPVVGVIVEILPELGADQARQKFHQAQSTGDSVLTVVNQEHAEAFVSQFHRSLPMVFADAQPE